MQNMKDVLKLNIVLLLILLKILHQADTCPVGWTTIASPPAPVCLCLKIVFVVPPGTTFMSSQKVCLASDRRSSLIIFNGTEEQQTINAAAGQAAVFGITNVPVGLYLDNSGNIRRFDSQQVTLPLTGVYGKCQYILPTDSFLTNNSCLQQVPDAMCYMPCDAAMPPPPVVGPDAIRCNDPSFNMTCAAGWINLGGLCYKNPVNSSTLLTRSDAAAACQAVGGWLPSFANLNEWRAVTTYAEYEEAFTGISGADSWAAPMWLGGTLNGNTKTWDDGTPWSFQYWAPYQPNGTSPCMYWSVGQGDYWSEGNCNIPGVVFCQQYTLCTTTPGPPTTSTVTTTTPTTTATTTPTTTTTTTIPTTTTTTTPTTTTTTTIPTTTTTTTPTTTTTTTIQTTTTTTTPTTTTTTTIPTTTTTTTPTTTPTTTTTTTIPTTTTLTPTSSPTITTTTISANTTTPTTTTTTFPTSTTILITTMATNSATTKTTTTAPAVTLNSTAANMISTSSTTITGITSDQVTVIVNPSSGSTLTQGVASSTTEPVSYSAAATSISLTTSSLATIVTNFAEQCTQNNQSLYFNGVCYTMYVSNVSQGAMNVCAANRAQLAVVRSADAAESFVYLYQQFFPAASSMSIWIGMPNNTATVYNQLQNTLSSDGYYRMTVNISNGQCNTLNCNPIDGNDLLISDNTSCSTELVYFCETAPKFQKKGCGQLLNGRIIQSLTSPNITDCARQCVANDSCYSVNYQSTNQTCQILDDNTSSQSLMCDLGWDYFERVM